MPDADAVRPEEISKRYDNKVVQSAEGSIQWEPTRGGTYPEGIRGEELSFLKTNIERVYDRLSIQQLSDLGPDAKIAPKGSIFLDVPDDTVDVFMRRLGDAITFAPSLHVNYASNMMHYLREERILSPRKVLKHWREALRVLSPFH